MNRTMKLAASFAVALLLGGGAAQAQTAPAQGFFEWDTNSYPATSNYTASPFLFNNAASAAQVAAVLAAAPAGKPLAVKIVEPLTHPDAKAIFNNHAVQYIFCDFEDVDAVGQTRAIADLALNSTKSKGAFVGNFNFYPSASSDGTRPPTVVTTAQSYQNRPANFQYTDSRGKTASTTGKLMANEALYPGAPDYRTAGTPNLPSPGATPNVRSALFTLPIIRATNADKVLPAGDQHIPWISRFNNWGNNALDTDGNPSNGFQYVQNAANPANGQLPSRGDFSAQVLHYRLRGVDSVNLFEASVSSVQGYTRAQARSDVATGWSTSLAVNGIFSRNKWTLANTTTVIGDTGNSSGDIPAQQKGLAESGAVWSGVYDNAATSGVNRRLAILISNLSNVSKTIDLPNLIGGFATYSGAPVSDDYVVAAGQHQLLTFTLTKNSLTNNQTAWLLDNRVNVFTDNNRNGVGIPEPTTLGLLGLGALGLLARRRRTA